MTVEGEAAEPARTGVTARMRLLGPRRPGRPPVPDAPRRRRLGRTRRVVTWFLVVLSALLVPLSVVTVWAVETVTNTDQYVTTLAPLAREKVVTNFVAAAATDKLFTSVEVQKRIERVLPDRAGFLAAPITSQLHGFVRRQLADVLQSKWFQSLWDRINRGSHAAVVAVLTGKKTPGARANEVVVDVTPVLTKVISALDKRGVTVFDGVRSRLTRANSLTLNLATSRQVSKARGAFSLASDLGWAVPLVAGILVVGAVAVAVDRRKALLRVAVGTALFAAVLLAGIALGRAFFVDHAAARVDPSVTGSVFDTLVRFLRDWLRVVVGIAVAVAVVLWLAGPGRWPRWIRSQVARAARWTGRRVMELGDEQRRAQASAAARVGGAWVVAHRSELRLAGAVVAGAVVVLGGNLSVDGVWWTAVGYLVYLAALEVVVAWARRASGTVPGATGQPGTGGTAGTTGPPTTTGPSEPPAPPAPEPGGDRSTAADAPEGADR